MPPSFVIPCRLDTHHLAINQRMRLVVLCWCITLGCLSADPETGTTTPASPSSPKSPAADYGPAFAQLIDLGYPDTKGATLVKLTLHGQAGREAAERAMYARQSGGGLTTDGNAWLLPGGTETVNTFLQTNFEQVTVAKTAKRGGFMRALIGPAKTADTAPEGTLPGDWEEVKVADDAKKLLKLLQTQSTEGRMLSVDRWSYDEDGPKWCARVLSLACQMYRAGHHAEANQVTAKLFDLAPEPILVVDYLINDLADREYKTLAEAFFENQDWQAYHDGTKELVDRFTRGWKTREGAQILLARLEQQLKGTKPSLAKLEGATLNPNAIEILDSWITVTEPIPISSQPCWLLGTDMLKFSKEQGYYGRPPETDGTPPGRIAELQAMGMDGFIALVAAATDDTLLPTQLVRGYGGYYDGYSRSITYSSSGNASPGLAQYKSMTRPTSRGEIARTILLDALPDLMGELQNALPETLQSTAHQWWLQHRNKTTSELARHYLEAGNSMQRQIAVLAMAHSNDDENAKAVEQFILESEDITDHFSLVDQYLRIRRGRARDFFTKYSAEMREVIGEEEDELDSFGGSNWRIREAGGIDKYLKKLSVYVDDVSPEKVLADIRKGALEYKEGFPMLQAAVQGKTIATHLPALVTIARNQDSPVEQLEALRAVQRLVYNDEPDYDTDEEYDALEQLYGEQVALSKDDWTYFLAQDTPADGEIYGTAPTFAAAAAWTMEMIYFDQHSTTMGQLSNIMDTDQLWTFCLERARRVLEEGPSAEFPEPADENRQAAIRKTLAPMSSIEVLQHYETLKLTEKLAWSEILDGYEEEPPDGVANLYKHVTKINWPNLDKKDADLKKALEKLTYTKVLDESLVKSVMQEMMDKAERYQHFTVYFQSNGKGTTGTTLSVISAEQMDEWGERILEGAYNLLREDKSKKVAGLYTTDEDGEELIGMIHDPAQNDNGFPLTPALERIETLLEDGRRFYTILTVETAVNLKKRDAEPEEDEDLLPSF